MTKELLEKLYTEEGLSTKQIADKLGVTKSAVAYRLKLFGVKMRTRDLTGAYELTSEELHEMYLVKLMSQKEIAKHIGRSQLYVRTRMKEFGIESRDSGTAQAMKRGIPFNERFFDEWSHDMAYMLGLMFADGNVYDCTFRLQLQERDVALVEATADLLEIPRKHIFTRVDKKFGSKSYGWMVSRRDTAKRLIELGVIPNKSRTMEFPEVPEQYLGDFIRGYFDGDGSVSESYNQLNVQFSCGSVKFVEGLVAVLSKELEHPVGVSFDKRGAGNYSVRFHSNRLAAKLYDFMYNSDSIICLERKKLKFETKLCQSRALSDRECNDL